MDGNLAQNEDIIGRRQHETMDYTIITAMFVNCDSILFLVLCSFSTDFKNGSCVY